MTDVYREVVDGPIQTRNLIVGSTAVQVNQIGFKFEKGALLYAPGANDPVPNTAPIWVGGTPNVTADQDVETGGFPIVPGASLNIPTELDSLFAISTVADQVLSLVGV